MGKPRCAGRTVLGPDGSVAEAFVDDGVVIGGEV